MPKAGKKESRSWMTLIVKRRRRVGDKDMLVTWVVRYRTEDG